MPFNLFRKKKPEEQTPAEAPQTEQPRPEAQTQVIEENKPEPEPSTHQETQPQPVAPTSEAPQESTVPPPTQPPEPSIVATEKTKEAVEPASKTYLKAMPLRELSDLDNIKSEVQNGNIIILKVTPLAQKSIEDVKTAVNDLYQFAENIGGDIARLGEERVVICPKSVRIWREKTPKPASNTVVPTAA